MSRRIRTTSRYRFKREWGYTIIEIGVALAVLAIVLMLAVPRYLGSRRLGFLAEADEQLNELKILALAYFHQHSTWDGLTSGNFATVLDFRPPPDQVGCFDYDLVTPGTATEIQLRATGDDTPGFCRLAAGTVVILTLRADGSSSRMQSLP
jgi:type II secretory pathway pseudopilin PulG